MPDTTFCGRAAVAIENSALRVTVLKEGGHLAELYDKAAGVSPLWVPPWPSIEPAVHNPAAHPLYGTGSDAKLLAGIMGHNLCLDLFGDPSPEELESGATTHGEASVNRYEIDETVRRLRMRVDLPLAQLSFERAVEIQGRGIRMTEMVKNLAALDRPLAWTQHVTLGPPFLDPATTEFRASVDRSIVSEADPGEHAYLAAGAKFDWPFAPGTKGRRADLRRMHPSAPASAYTAHRGSPAQEHTYFTAFSPIYRLSLSYIWKRAEFPWLGLWEENCSRSRTPWNRRTVARGVEFGLSPMPETRRKMIARASLFETPVYGWLPANGQRAAEYWIVLQSADAMPDCVPWPPAS